MGGTGGKLGPAKSGFHRLSTRSVPAAQRFDFWRGIHSFIDLDVSQKEKRKDFNADLKLYHAADGSTFGFVSSDDVVSRFARSDDEYVLFSLCLSGAVKIRTDSDVTRTVTPASGLTVMDGTRPMTTMSDGHSHVYLTIPKVKLVPGLADKPGLLRDGLYGPPPEGLASILTSCLVMIASQSDRLDEHATAVAVNAAVDIAVGTLARAHADLGATPDERYDEALHAAACRYIQLHLGDPDLTSARIARALGCSRAHLYRIFALHDQGIGEMIRAGRLHRASALLAAAPDWHIERIAMECGFASPSAFARAFRDRNGLTPTAFREGMRDK